MTPEEYKKWDKKLEKLKTNISKTEKKLKRS